MGKNLEIKSGDRFNRWRIIKEVARHIRPSGGVVRRFECQCECGNIKDVRLVNLRSGASMSCGCLNKEKITTHNQTYSTEYNSWYGIKQRCTNKNNYKFRLYGGRGITVCKRWLKFENFLEDMGKKPSRHHSIDRIDSEKGYYKENCRWATYKQQNNNTSRNHYVEYMGKIYTLTQLSRKTGVKYNMLKARINSGWDVKRAINTKKGKHLKFLNS